MICIQNRSHYVFCHVILTWHFVVVFYSADCCAMYSVVVFAPVDRHGEEEVEAVPSVWLSPHRSHCHWPLLRSQGSISRAMREQRIPEPGWITHVANVLKTYGKCCLLSIEKEELLCSV